MAFKNIDMVKFLQCVDLPLKHLFGWPVFERLQINDFDGNLLFAFLINSSEYTWAVAFAYEISKPIRVIFYFFPHFIIVWSEPHSNLLYLELNKL